jgi:hypothetical protein
MNWIFEGIGTLVVGIILGAGGDRIYYKRKTVQKQRAGKNATQIQGGHDVTLNGGRAEMTQSDEQ